MDVDTAWPVLAEPRRLQILQLIWTAERSAGDIAAHFEVTFGAISQHLARLREAGLVRVRRAGRQRYYSADRVALAPFAPALEAYWSDSLVRLKQLAESAEGS